MNITGQPRRVHVTRWGAIPWQPFEALVGLLLLSGCVRILVYPADTLYSPPPVLAYVMAVVYAVGGVSIILGLWRMWDRVELLGLLCLTIIGALRVVDAVVYDTGHASSRTVVFIAAMTAAIVRARQITTGRSLVQLDGPA